MDIKHHTSHSMLEQYSFYWSELRLLIAALALFLGGIPPVYYFFGYSFSGLLNLCWIISGVASVYLLFRWSKAKTLFGGKDNLDLAAFFVMVVSGLNLGITGLMGRNIGMSIASSKLIFIVVGIIYLASAYHLHKRWKHNGRKIF